MRGAREGKKQRLVKVSQLFLSETVVFLVQKIINIIMITSDTIKSKL